MKAAKLAHRVVSRLAQDAPLQPIENAELLAEKYGARFFHRLVNFPGEMYSKIDELAALVPDPNWRFSFTGVFELDVFMNDPRQVGTYAHTRICELLALAEKRRQAEIRGGADEHG